MIHHFLLPHKHKKQHKKAHLISVKALAIYMVVFVFMQALFFAIRITQPGVLGTTSEITRQEIITLTNSERQKVGLTPLKEKNALDKAAEAKAKNMFAENYWAHISPSGTTPWYWIKQENYNYSYAGENLARGYSKSDEVMKAWMASTMGHKENVLGNNYQEIGIAVEDGVINGEKTTLVVQIFGTPEGALVARNEETAGEIKTNDDNKLATTVPSGQAQLSEQEVKTANIEENLQPQSFLSKFVTINPYAATQTFSMFLIALLVFVGFIDIIVLWRRKVLAKLHSRHLPHTGVIVGMLIIYFIMQAGAIV